MDQFEFVRRSTPSESAIVSVGRGLRYASHALRNGVAFIIFGMVAAWLTLFAAPISRRFAKSAEEREIRTQWLVHRGYIFFVWIIETLRLGRIHIEGAERLTAPGTLVVANHPTLVDVVALIAYMPQADCVVKQATLSNPVLRGLVKGTGYLSNSSGPELVEECVRRLRSGRSLVLFPEGTRSPEKGLGHLHRGAAHVALVAGCDLIPVVITCDPPALMKGVPWWIVPDRPFDLRLRVGEPLSPREFVPGKRNRAIAARVLTARLREFFEKGIADAGS